MVNDITVSEAVDGDQFVTRMSQYGRDTPYLLLYHRLGLEDAEERLPAVDKLGKVISDNLRCVEEARLENERLEKQRVEDEKALKRMATYFETFTSELEMSPPKIRKL